MLHQLLDFALLHMTAGEIDERVELWRDITENLVDYPHATDVDRDNHTIFADYEGAGPPPRTNQLNSALQPIYPAGQIYVSMGNQTQLEIAKNTMELMDFWGDGFL